VSYYPNGQIKEQGEYIANKKHNPWKEYNEAGELIKTSIYKSGLLMEEK
jgi:antitoxin component YwqK of YwqJK toxin-antitoxin module